MKNKTTELTETAKRNFHNRMARALRSLALEMGILADCDIRSCKGGPGVWGEVVLHHEKVYVQVHFAYGEPRVMYRTCEGRKDYSGGVNRFMTVEQLFSERGRAQLQQVIDYDCSDAACNLHVSI